MTRFLSSGIQAHYSVLCIRSMSSTNLRPYTNDKLYRACTKTAESDKDCIYCTNKYKEKALFYPTLTH